MKALLLFGWIAERERDRSVLIRDVVGKWRGKICAARPLMAGEGRKALRETRVKASFSFQL